MQVVHHPADAGGDTDAGSGDTEDAGPSGTGSAGRVLATDAETADWFLARARGLMFRRSVPDGYALVFPFDGVASRDLHMVFVPFAIDALWLVDGTVQKRKRLRPWLGVGFGEADTVIELPAGAADAVEPGDRIELLE